MRKSAKYWAISMGIEEQRITVKNSEKQRSSPLFFASRDCSEARISAPESRSAAVNFWEEQRKQRGRASR
jgi:hypothetical protein